MGEFFGYKATKKMSQGAPNEMTFNPSINSQCALGTGLGPVGECRKGLPGHRSQEAWRLAGSEHQGSQAKQFAPGRRGTMKDTNGVKGQWLSAQAGWRSLPERQPRAETLRRKR